MAVQYIDDGRSDGAVLGNPGSTATPVTPKLGFFGLATPIAQPALSAFPAVATTAVINASVSASAFGFTSAQATSIITLVNGLRAALVSLGLAAT